MKYLLEKCCSRLVCLCIVTSAFCEIFADQSQVAETKKSEEIQKTQEDVKKIQPENVLKVAQINESVKKIFTSDSAPMLKLDDTPDASNKKVEIPNVVVPKSEKITVTVGNNDMCLVRDVRKLPIGTGISRAKFFHILSSAIPESFSILSTKQKGKISMRSYEFHRINMSKLDLLKASIGKNIFYQDVTEKGDDVKSGKLIDFYEDAKHSKFSFVVIRNGRANLVDGLERFVGLEEPDYPDSSCLSAEFASDNPEDEVALSYLIRGLKCFTNYDIRIREKENQIDVISKTTFTNNTMDDFKNVQVVMKDPQTREKTGAENFGQSSQQAPIINVDKCSSTTYVTQKINVPHKIEYEVKIHEPDLDNLRKIEKTDASVRKVLVVENAQEYTSNSDRTKSNVTIYQQIDNMFTFLFREQLVKLTKDDDLHVELGNERNASAEIKLTDYRAISKTQSEYSFVVSLKNDTPSDITLFVKLDMDSKKHKIIKSSVDQIKDKDSVWGIELKPNEGKELHIRIRVEK